MTMSNGNLPEQIVFRIRRFSPGRDKEPVWKEYRVAYEAGMTVLDGLWKIKESIDPTLAWRASCRMGVCGSCGMLINGSAKLGCNTQISELATSVVSVAPLPNFPIVRDLVPDLQLLFDDHAALSPYIIRADSAEQEDPTGEYYQTSKEMESYLQFSYCIKCACCMAACPTCATDALYSGPMALAQAHRYNTDTRDDGFEVRKQVLAGETGPWRCHFAGECSRVCPKGVDPAKAIQFMKQQLVADALGLRKKRPPAPLLKKPEGIQRRPGIPEAPEPTIG
jgi:succinate dehydrogenase / fumarate reductase iron-sulfur subunit